VLEKVLSEDSGNGFIRVVLKSGSVISQGDIPERYFNKITRRYCSA